MYYSWEQIWALFMTSSRTRRWLFDNTPPPRTHVVNSLLASPLLLGYVFASNHSPSYTFPDIGDLVSVYTRDKTTTLGFNFGFKGINPVFPMLFQVLKDPMLLNPNVIVRRFARRRAPPPYEHLFLNMEFSWFESGVLSVVTNVTNTNLSSTPGSGKYPLIANSSHRVFSKQTAIRLSHMADMLDGFSSHVLPPDFINPPDDYYVLHIVEPPEDDDGKGAVSSWQGGRETSPSYDVERTSSYGNSSPYASNAASSSSNSDPHQHVQPAVNGKPGSTRLHDGEPSAVSALGPKSENRSVVDASRKADFADTLTEKVWRDHQQIVMQSRRTGIMITMMGKKVGDRHAKEEPVYGRESRYMFLTTAGVDVNGRIQKLCAQLNIRMESPFLDQSLLGAKRKMKWDAAQKNYHGHNVLMPNNPLNMTSDWSGPHAEARHFQGKKLTIDSYARAHGSVTQGEADLLSLSDSERTHDYLEDSRLRKRRRRAEYVDVVDATDSNHNDLLQVNDGRSLNSGLSLPHWNNLGGRNATSYSIQPNSRFDPLVSRRSFHLGNILSTSGADQKGIRRPDKVERTNANPADLSTAQKNAEGSLVTIKEESIKGESESGFEDTTESKVKMNREMPKRSGVGIREKGTNKMVWTCEKCGVKIRGKKGNLNRHIANKHDNIRAFACTEPNCGRKFQTRLNLVRHQTAVHLGRPFQCPRCPRTFKGEKERDAHVKAAHTGNEVQLACHVCGSCFGRRSTLNRHLAKVHKTKMVSMCSETQETKFLERGRK